MVVALSGYFVYALAEYGRVSQVVAGNEDVFPVFGVRLRHVGGADEEFADEDDGQDDAHYTQRISHGAAQGGAVGVDAHLLQRLLRGAERDIARLVVGHLQGNRTRAAEVLVDGGEAHLVRERERVSDLWRLERTLP